MNIKNTLFCLLLLFTCHHLPMAADNAKSVLDKTSAMLKNNGGLQASFESTMFKGTQETGTTSGTIHVQGNKFKIVSPQLTTWFNGKTQWSLMTGSTEAYVSTPTATELQAINPYTFVNLYKSGYSYSMKDTQYNGKTCHEVRLTAKNKKNNIQEMRIVIDKTTFIPNSIRIKQSNGNWLRIRVRNLKTGNTWNDHFFEFKKAEHPDVEIIDLR